MAIWTNEALMKIKGKGFLTTAFADDVWIVCKPEFAEEAKLCLQTSFEAAGLSINPSKVQVWAPNDPKHFEVLGMPCFDGRVSKVSEAIVNKTVALLACGEDREYVLFKRIAFANSVCLPAVRYWVGGLSLSQHSSLILSIDRLIRRFVRGRDWSSNTPIDFMSDKDVGFSLLSLSVESVRDLISFVWKIVRGGESLFLRSFLSESWREALSGRDHACALLKDWVEVVRGLDGKTHLDWILEEKNRPRHLRTTNVFPFGDKGSFLFESLQKWSEGPPLPPRCANKVCFQNPCQVLQSARDKGWIVAWVRELKKNQKKFIFSIVREGLAEVFSKVCVFNSAALEKGCRNFVRENPKKNILFLSAPTLKQPNFHITQTHSKSLTTQIHEMKEEPWALRIARERAHEPSLSEVRIPLVHTDWGKEKCGNFECCVSPCTHYTDAKMRGDLLLWTDASFFPESGKCAAAFGFECSDGMKISSFRVRGPASRGELLAIFAALKSYSHSEKNLSIFSDCESAIKKIEKLISLSKVVSGDSLHQKSVSLSSLESRIFSVIRHILGQGHSISLHWVKGHSGIIQNELLDQAAKKEAQNKKRESLFEEVPETVGELTLKDKMIESREEISYTEWRPDLDKSVMKAAKSWMARRTMAGIEQWRGLKPSWGSSDSQDCTHCHEKHSLKFEYFLEKCPACADFRKIVQKIWEGVGWNDELLEGRVKKQQVKELGERVCSGSREETVREGRERVRKWEKALLALRKSL